MSRPRLLIIDDDHRFVAKLESALEGLFRVDACYSAEAFWDRFAVGRYDLLVIDMRLREGREGLELLKEALNRDPEQAAIVMTAYADTESYADAISAGALTYLDKREFSPPLIGRTVEAIVEQGALRRRLAATERRLEVAEPQEMIGISAGIKAVGEQIRGAAEDGYVPVLIEGEPGSGRELAARTLHRLSRRRNGGPFVSAPCRRADPLDPAALLFGALQSLEGVRPRDSKGWIDAAKGGILYVDGFENRDANTATMLARLIETGRFTRSGGTQAMDADAQIVVSVCSGTGAPGAPDEMRAALTTAGGITIAIPPLRERREDIPLIAQYTLQRFFRLGRTLARSFRGVALSALEARGWPGNVRELKSAIEYAAVRADAAGDREIGPEHLPMTVMEGPTIPTASASAMNYKLHLARAELGLVELAIEHFETTTKSILAERLQYNDRYIFARRIRKLLTLYPALGSEFPQTVELFDDGHTKDQRRAS